MQLTTLVSLEYTVAMNHDQIKKFLSGYDSRRTRTIVIVDFSNVEKWKESLGWSIGIKELGHLVKNFSTGSKYLRRFYYGSDYGQFESSNTLNTWSRSMLEKAAMNGFEVITKRVKYMYSDKIPGQLIPKCDLDVEMAVDLMKEKDNYDTMIIFSGDGDLSYAVRHLARDYEKKCIVFGARNHIGREIIDAKNEGIIEHLLYAEDFDYRLRFSGQNRKPNR